MKYFLYCNLILGVVITFASGATMAQAPMPTTEPSSTSQLESIPVSALALINKELGYQINEIHSVNQINSQKSVNEGGSLFLPSNSSASKSDIADRSFE